MFNWFRKSEEELDRDIKLKVIRDNNHKLLMKVIGENLVQFKQAIEDKDVTEAYDIYAHTICLIKDAQYGYLGLPCVLATVANDISFTTEYMKTALIDARYNAIMEANNV